jgi:hypothetical protein
MAARVAAFSAGSKSVEFGISACLRISCSMEAFSMPPDAHLTPAGDGHVLDEGFLEGGLRLEFFEQCGEETKKAIRGLALENYRAGQHAVGEGVTGGGDLALRSDRAVGF